MYYNCTYDISVQFLKSPQITKNSEINNSTNMFSGKGQTQGLKNNLSTSSNVCPLHVYKKMLTKFRSHITDQKRRQAFEKHELKNVLLKGFLTRTKTSMFYYGKSKLRCLKPCTSLLGSRLVLDKVFKSSFLTSHGAFSKVRNRCILTARNTTYCKFGLSRIMFRKLAGLGMLPGVLKSS